MTFRKAVNILKGQADNSSDMRHLRIPFLPVDISSCTVPCCLTAGFIEENVGSKSSQALKSQQKLARQEGSHSIQVSEQPFGFEIDGNAISAVSFVE